MVYVINKSKSEYFYVKKRPNVKEVIEWMKSLKWGIKDDIMSDVDPCEVFEGDEDWSDEFTNVGIEKEEMGDEEVTCKMDCLIINKTKCKVVFVNDEYYTFENVVDIIKGEGWSIDDKIKDFRFKDMTFTNAYVCDYFKFGSIEEADNFATLNPDKQFSHSIVD